MNPQGRTHSAGRGPLGRTPMWVHAIIGLTITASFLLASPVEAQRRKRRPGKKKTPVASVKEKKAKKGGKNQVFDFTGLTLGASIRTPQLLYFLDRASDELQRASLQHRSFVPEMVLSITEEGL